MEPLTQYVMPEPPDDAWQDRWLRVLVGMICVAGLGVLVLIVGAVAEMFR